MNRLATLLFLALATVSTSVDTLPVSGPAGSYTIVTTGPTRITSGAGWARLDWAADTAPVVTPPAPMPAPTPTPVPEPAPAPKHSGHFTVSYIEPKYPSPASGAIRDGLAATDWAGLDTTYRAYTDGQAQLTRLGFTPLYKDSDLPMCFLQEDGPKGATVVDTLKFPSSAETVVVWVKGFR